MQRGQSGASVAHGGAGEVLGQDAAHGGFSVCESGSGALAPGGQHGCARAARAQVGARQAQRLCASDGGGRQRVCCVGEEGWREDVVDHGARQEERHLRRRVRHVQRQLGGALKQLGEPLV